jgi:uncharacterized CHY-type Zn-finger protein
MKLIEAKELFSKMEFHSDTDYKIYPKTIYECYACHNRLSFSMQNFQKYALNQKSILAIDEQKKFSDFINKNKIKTPNSFIEFYCPQCNSYTRLYYDIGYEGKSTFVSILKYILIDDDTAIRAPLKIKSTKKSVIIF